MKKYEKKINYNNLFDCYNKHAYTYKKLSYTKNQVIQKTKLYKKPNYTHKSEAFVGTYGYTNSYLLLWCNHFWQKDSFFTMEHVSKLSFCLCCTTSFFIPIKTVFSESSARDWRHKIMQRFSLFTSHRKYSYKYQAFKETFLGQKQLYVQGHSKSDRAEAILFNLIRGAGIDGISTLQWQRTFFYNSSYKFYPRSFDLY